MGGGGSSCIDLPGITGLLFGVEEMKSKKGSWRQEEHRGVAKCTLLAAVFCFPYFPLSFFSPIIHQALSLF